jgi:hypothetical protein
MKVNKDARRAWLRALRCFKHGVKIRAKLGILQTYCDQVEAERRGKHTWDSPYWEDDKWVTLLYTCIKNNEYPPELLEGFVKSAEAAFFRPAGQPTVKMTVAVVNDICKQLSKQLRRKFGVFS